MVLPVANQADHIERVVDAHLQALRTCDAEVELVLAVNNSGDESMDICGRLAAHHRPQVAMIATSPGFGCAIREGLAAARGSVVGFANSARTQPADLAHAVELALAHPDALVKGERDGTGYSLPRRAGSWIYNAECRVLFGVRVHDVNGNPKIWRRALLPPEHLNEKTGFIDAEVLIAAHAAGMEVISFPVTSTERHGGRSMTTLRLAARLYSRPLAVRLARRQVGQRTAGCELS